ncbi:3-dehydroquinate synthase [Virgibacillus salexigens]|uniref:3-dehydroquinate synthase n=1 Tax=Virgibacillus massiliensis TaxID=1462526 RepID=UPI001927FA86|nr:3-dehydroquinate synthase [Virgibacillus massiliensis]
MKVDEIVVNSSSHSYRIMIGNGIRSQISTFVTKAYSSIFIVTDEHIADLYLSDIQSGLTHEYVYTSILPAGEKTKCIEYYYQLQTEAIKYGLDRNSLIIALGGGVIGDLAGFVASTFMRGIDYIQVPTTILAHDSSVGGKVAINHRLGKNLIGSFYPPQAVIYDVETLQSLSEQEIRSGYAELIKEALISDELTFRAMLKTDLTSLSAEELQEHLRMGIKVKASIVEADEKESGIRKFLNLGHTLGHALEAELGYGSLTHGEAVAIGLLFSFHISESILSTHLPYDQLHEWFKKNNFPLIIQTEDIQSLMMKMKKDKKNVSKMIQMVLLQDIGEPTLRTVTDKDMERRLNSFIGKLVTK